MAKSFIAVIEGLTADQHKRFADKLQSPVGWWHHINGCWLIRDPEGTYSAPNIRDMLNEIAPGKVCAVFEVSPRDWAFRLETARIEDSDAWMNSFWKRGG